MADNTQARVSRERTNTRATRFIVMNERALAVLDARIERARQLVAEQQQRAQTVRTLDDAAQSCQLLHDLQYWLDNLESHRKDLIRQSR
jgi:hypothetical protein